MFSRKVLQLTLAAGLIAALAAPAAAAGGAEVTAGEFTTLSGGAALGYDIDGHAVMRRIPGQGGKTTVTVHLTGLDADTVYPTHVHNAPCSATPAGGGHYQHQIGGAVDHINEMWPIVRSNAAGVGWGAANHGHWARPDAMSVVVHYPVNPSIRLACADLS